MTHRLPILTLLACSCAAALPAHATDMKPGLWETTSTMRSADPRMQSAMAMAQERMASMSPEQRAKLEQMMKQHGVKADFGQNGQLHAQICMTREMAARREFPVQTGNCQQKYTRLTADKGRISLSCDKPRLSGEGEITMTGDSAYQGHMHVNSQAGAGQDVSVDTEVSGRWLASDCSDIRPMTPSKTN